MEILAWILGISAIVFAAGIVPVFFFGPWALTCVFGPFALIQSFRVAKNARTQKTAKAEQRVILEDIWERDADEFFSRPAVKFKGKWVLKPFYDIRVDGELTNTQAEHFLRMDLTRLADGSELNWWKLDRAKSL